MIKLRKVEYSDINLLYRWANDPIVRKNSFNSAPISFDAHKDWFNKMMDDPSVFQFILMDENTPVGQIRLNINGEDVSKYGSQGQKRTALLTLKLANFEVFIDEKDDIPILLLDDIMSELDSKRISFLLKYIENYQSIITTTDASFVKDVKNIVISSVKCGKVE